MVATEEGGGTMHGTVPSFKESRDTKMSNVAHVSAHSPYKTTECCFILGVSSTGQVPNGSNELGLIIAEQKPKRVELEGPSTEPTTQDMDLTSRGFLQKKTG